MTSTKGRILIIDDDHSIRRALRSALSAMGFEIEEEASGERGMERERTASFDAVLLDINMQGLGGIETCRMLRGRNPRIGIIMLTVRDDAEDKVTALDAGADDYVTKPFVLRELAARLRATIRRVRGDQDNAPSIRIGDLEINPEKRLLTKEGQPIHLTPKEFDLLHYLMSHAGIPIPHVRLLRAVWGPEYGGEVEYLRTFVRQLRKKMDDAPDGPHYLLTEAYVGYRFRDALPDQS